MARNIRDLALAAGAAAGLLCTVPVHASEADDRAEIIELMNRYAMVHDFGSAQAYAALFTHDGEMTVGETVLVKGSEAITAMAARDHERLSITLPDGSTAFKMLHLISNTVIDSLDGDTATGSCVVTTFLRDSEGAPHLFSIGRYVDRYAREDGQWKIARREIVSDLTDAEAGRKYLSGG